LRLKGKHQHQNASLAVTAIKALEKVSITENDIQKGLENAFIAGRMEVINEKPLVIIDAAHNPAAAEVVHSAMKEITSEPIIWVWGMAEGKHHAEFAEALAPNVKKIYLCQSKYRGVAPEELMRVAEQHCTDWVIEKDVASAVQRAIEEASEKDVILVTGSVFVAGEARTNGKVKHSM